MHSRFHRYLRGAARALLLVCNLAALPAVAQNSVVPATTLDALCRKDLHKTVGRLARISLQQMSRCHDERLRGVVAPSTDCNDDANAPTRQPIAREQKKVQLRAEKSCDGGPRPGASRPATLGYDSCPAPCDAIPIDDSYASVASCLLCVAEKTTESLAASTLGTAMLPLSSGERRCQKHISAQLKRYMMTLVMTQHQCQTRLERGLRPASTDCKTADERGRVARAKAALRRTLSRCTDAQLARLDSCASTTAGEQTCVPAAAEGAAAAIFDAVFRQVQASSGTPTATAAVTDTPAPTATPTDVPAATATPTDTAAPVNSPTPAPTDTPAPTETPTAVDTTTPTPTDTPVPTETPMPTDTVAADTPTPTSTPTDTPPPTATPTATPTETPTPTGTPTDTPSSTPAPTDTPTATPTATASATETPTALPACDDGSQNGDETDVDCGGSCSPCPDFKWCSLAEDCISGVCSGGSCQVPQCDDGAKNGGESDVDCGGSCLPCAVEQSCVQDSDCASDNCVDGGFCGCGAAGFVFSKTATIQTCTEADGVDDWGGGQQTRTSVVGCEVTVDNPIGQAISGQDAGERPWQIAETVGFTSCSPVGCSTANCASPVAQGVCSGGNYPFCNQSCQTGGHPTSQFSVQCDDQQPTCSDGHRSPGFGETDIDCGGPCDPCGDGLGCADATDCESLVCTGGFCQAATCSDGVKNQGEGDVDCGGPCNLCPAGDSCNDGTDCVSGVCSGNVCQPTCSDGVINQDETDTDCGGSCAQCPAGGACSIDDDCVNGLCDSGTCSACPIAAPVSAGGWLAHSPDDIGLTNVPDLQSLSGNDAVVDVNLPFVIDVEGVSYSSITISTNGWIEFGGNTADPNDASDPTNDCLPTAEHTNPFLAAYWDDLAPIAPENVRYGTTGTAPNRVFFIDFRADLAAGEPSPGGNDDFAFQIQLREDSSLISVKYRDAGPDANGQEATLGYQGAGGASATTVRPLSCDGKVLDDNQRNEGWSVDVRAAAVVLSAKLASSPDDLGSHITGLQTLSGDDATADATLPFAVTIDGVDYTTLTLSTNGWIEFGGNTADPNDASDPSNDCLPTAAHANPFLAAYWDDMGTFGTEIRYGTLGTAPNRVFIADFVQDVKAEPSNDVIAYQVQVHEGSNAIHVKYRRADLRANGQSATIGFQSGSGVGLRSNPIGCNAKVLDDNLASGEGQAWSIQPMPSGVTVHAALWASSDDLGGEIADPTTLSGDEATTDYVLPFPVVIEGVAYPSITVSTNGWIEFGGNTLDPNDPSPADPTNDALPTAAHTNPFLAAYWDDMRTHTTHVQLGTMGQAPNRVTVVDFALDVVDSINDSNDDVRFQVLIHERSNVIHVSYREAQALASGQTATIGFQGVGGSTASVVHGLGYDARVLDDNRPVLDWSIAPAPDCGGLCGPCAAGAECSTGGDCEGGVCSGGTCLPS